MGTVVIAVVAILASGGLMVGALNAYVVLRARRGTDDVSRLPHAQVALVLGAAVDEDGRMSPMLADRVARGLEVWRAGKVDRVLVTGGVAASGYDEAETMRSALMADGVPEASLITDRAGVNTWASMVRAPSVFDVRSAIVVTQGFHMARALFLADAAGLEAAGLTADLRGYGAEGVFSVLREVLARVKAVGSATLRRLP